MRLPKIITRVDRAPDRVLYPNSVVYYVPSQNAAIQRSLTQGFPLGGRKYILYQLTPDGEPWGQLGGADTLEQALRLLGWTPLRPPRQPPRTTNVGSRWVPRVRTPGRKRPAPARLSASDRAAGPPSASSGASPQAESDPRTNPQAESDPRKRQTRKEDRKAEREARVDALMKESDEMVANNPGMQPLQRSEAELYERVRRRRGPVLSAYDVTLLFRRLNRPVAPKPE